jgi:hypothetical protein
MPSRVVRAFFINFAWVIFTLIDISAVTHWTFISLLAFALVISVVIDALLIGIAWRSQTFVDILTVTTRARVSACTRAIERTDVVVALFLVIAVVRVHSAFIHIITSGSVSFETAVAVTLVATISVCTVTMMMTRILEALVDVLACESSFVQRVAFMSAHAFRCDQCWFRASRVTTDIGSVRILTDVSLLSHSGILISFNRVKRASSNLLLKIEQDLCYVQSGVIRENDGDLQIHTTSCHLHHVHGRDL